MARKMKQAVVVRTDLKMGKGKTAAQVAHASLAASEDAARKRNDWYETWKDGGQKKVVLKVQTEDELRDVYKKARSAGLPASLIEDAGLTQLEPGTATCVGVGPGPDGAVDAITGMLKLL